MSNKPSLLVISNPLFIANELEKLRKKGHKVHIFDTTGLSPPEARRELCQLAQTHHYNAVLLLSGTFALRPLDGEFFKYFLPKLQFVSGLGAGYDSLDIDFLTKNKIIYCNSPIAVSDPTATTATMLILQTIRGATLAEQVVKSGGWEHGQRPERTPDVRDVTVGIVGLGTIGKLVQKKVEALGMKVIYNNRRRLPPSEEGSATYHTLPSLLRTADLISLHTPLTSETHHLIGAAELETMKDGVFIVNTARGEVIDEEALVEAMKKGKVERVGLDVFEHEPKVHPYLMSSPRATTLPHFGAATTRGSIDGEYEVLNNFKAWLANGRGNTPVNLPNEGW